MAVARQSKPQFLKYTPKQSKQQIDKIYEEIQKDIEQAVLDSARYRLQDPKQSYKALAVGDNADELYEILINHPDYPKKKDQAP